MGRKVRIESDDVLIIRTAPIFQPLLAPARYKDSAQKARDVPPPMPRIVRPGGRQHRLELATQRQTAKLTLSQLINRLLPNARRCGIVAAIAAGLSAPARGSSWFQLGTSYRLILLAR